MQPKLLPLSLALTVGLLATPSHAVAFRSFRSSPVAMAAAGQNDAEQDLPICGKAQQHGIASLSALPVSTGLAMVQGLANSGMLEPGVQIPHLAAAKVFCISNAQGRYFHPEERLVPIPFDTDGPVYEQHVLPSVLLAAGGSGHASNAHSLFKDLDKAIDLDSAADRGQGSVGSINVPGRSPSKADFGGARLHLKGLVTPSEVQYFNGLFDQGIGAHNDSAREVNVALSELPKDFMDRVRARARQELKLTKPIFYETGKIREAHHTFQGHADNSFFDPQTKLRLPLPNGMFRTWTLDVALNDPRNYTGGALNFVHPLPMQKLRPELGDAVLFESGVLNVHKVGKVSSGQRRVLLIWLHSEEVIGEHGHLADLYQAVSTESGTTGNDPRTPDMQHRRADVLVKWAKAHEDAAAAIATAH